MRVVPVLFPCDVGHADRGRYAEGSVRGAPDLLLGALEDEGVRFAPSVPVIVEPPVADDAPEAPLMFDEAAAKAVHALAAVVERINAAADFPLVLGGDQLTMVGHVLGHSRRHDRVGLAILAGADLPLEAPGTPHYDDPTARKSDATRPRRGNAADMSLTACLGRLPEGSKLAAETAACAADAARTSIMGVRAPLTAQVRANERKAGVDVWTMERLELDGESAYRSRLTQHLSAGPIVLSLDVRGLDPHLMTAVREPRSDGLDWSFIKRTLEQCHPHVDRILGLDISELDPSQDDAHHGSTQRFAETVAPFLRRLSR